MGAVFAMGSVVNLSPYSIIKETLTVSKPQVEELAVNIPLSEILKVQA